ncbi:glycosyl transferase family protein [Sphingomonas cannabina]|uniref:glycosyl transferase family protein n=1 Tax=Sphingomonas cannabina TaxID=2899123 RepID=UPI001F48223C|nr:glycosyl transferase family protein [Sphingomonas cannabina]UIJ45928.1 glycosyl transferase family protein [Sphingomonas cannabina]
MSAPVARLCSLQGEKGLDGGIVTGLIDVAARETIMFAATGFLVGGVDDLIVDAVYFARLGWRRATGRRDPLLAELPPPSRPIAVFVPSWDEAAVIGRMLRTAVERWPHPGLRIYAGAYPNDWETIEAIAAVALDDPRVRLVVGTRAGPTTKADCLNSLWTAMLNDEAAGLEPAVAVVLHDSEDVVHAGELAVYDHLIGDYDAVQVPVLPLVDRDSRLVAGTYIDEFVESHAKQLVVRQAVGAGLPFAGVGCAMSREMLGRVAEARGGKPFDAASLTEDYELGLTISALGGRVAAPRVREHAGGLPVAVHAYFPGTVEAAVRQRARWMFGIAFAGWDRLGWAGSRGIGDYWMRMRDRRQPLGVLVLAAAYAALFLWGVSVVRVLVGGTPLPVPHPWVQAVLALNLGLLVWRIAVRAGFIAASYGWAEAALSMPRLIVGNVIALMAARRALFRYVGTLRGARPHWDKTAHRFPTEAELMAPEA